MSIAPIFLLSHAKAFDCLTVLPLSQTQSHVHEEELHTFGLGLLQPISHDTNLASLLAFGSAITGKRTCTPSVLCHARHTHAVYQRHSKMACHFAVPDEFTLLYSITQIYQVATIDYPPSAATTLASSSGHLLKPASLCSSSLNAGKN